jgi:tetratricopeptide (TPR) repeat protein
MKGFRLVQHYFVLLLIVFSAVSAAKIACASLRDQEKAEILTQANDFFHRANENLTANPPLSKELYQKALFRYERLVKEGVRNGKLFYNIGNTYYRLDDIGRAILNYRRAGFFIPDDPDFIESLTFVLTKRRDSIEEKQKKQVLKTIFFWHYDISAKIKIWIFSVFYCASLALGATKLLKHRSLSGWWVGAPFFVGLLFFGSLMMERIAFVENRMGVLVDYEVTARKGDGETYQPSFEDSLHAGTEFRLIEDRGQWYHIEVADGRRCWIKARSGELVIDGSF